MRKMMVIVLLLAVAAWAGSATQPGGGGAGNDRPEKAPPAVLRIYDVRDYLSGVSNYPLVQPPTRQGPTSRPALKGLNSNSGPEPIGIAEIGQNDKPGSAQDRLDGLIRTIETIVDPDIWQDSGGLSTIVPLDGKLYVSAPVEIQAQVAKLIGQLSAAADRTVRISATWLSLTSDELAALRDPPPLPAAGDDTLVPLSKTAMEKTKPFASGQLLCLDGQTVHITAGSGRIKLQVRPILTAAKGQVVVDVLSEIDDPNARHPTSKPADPAPPSPTPVPIQHFHTTARIPLGTNVIIGGITANAASGEPAKELYLVVRVDGE